MLLRTCRQEDMEGEVFQLEGLVWMHTERSQTRRLAGLLPLVRVGCLNQLLAERCNMRIRTLLYARQ